MAKTIEAIYENGVFRPLEAVDLPEGETVQVTLPETKKDLVDPVYTIYEMAEETGIKDLATNIDHYLYGLPKRCP
jgi:predicted DNA-binding antitoxin AbrB/MazE fold protein